MALFDLQLPNPSDILFGQDLFGAKLQAPPVILIELTGQRRRIELHARALPFRPVSWGGRMRTKLTWYQGNPVATQQVLGPEEQPTSMGGKWSDRYIQGTVFVDGNPNVVQTAEQCVRLFDDVRRSGNTLHVVWGSESRVGVLQEFEANYDAAEDVAWRAVFEWSGRGEEQALRVADAPAPNLLGDMNALDDLLAFGPTDVVLRVQESLLATVDRVRAKVGEAFDVIRVINQVASTPAILFGALSNALQSIAAELDDELSRLMEVPSWGASATLPTSQGSPSAVARVAALLSVDRHRHDVAAAMSTLRDSALRMGEQAEVRAAPAALTVVTVPADTSMYALASRFYGDPDLAGYLARRNGLQSMIAPAGFQLVAPPRPDPASAREAC